MSFPSPDAMPAAEVGRAVCARRAPRLVRFLMVGASGMFVDMLAFSFLLGLAPIAAARAAAIWLAMTWNFALNRGFTFSARGRDSMTRQYFLFCGSCLVGAGVNWSVSLLLCQTSALFRERAVLAAAAGVAAGVVFNYLLCCRIVFRPQRGE